MEMNIDELQEIYGCKRRPLSVPALQSVETQGVGVTSCFDSASVLVRLAALHGGNVAAIEALP